MTMRTRRMAAGLLYVGVMVVIAAVAAWQIYLDSRFIALVAACSTLAACVALLAYRRHWGGWAITGMLVLLTLLVGIPLAVPSRMGTAPDLVRGLADLGTGIVFGWKDLVTVSLPVGTYRNLLVPAFVVFLVGTCLALLAAWRRGRIAYAAVPVALAMVAFGLLFGRTSVSAPVALGPLVIAAPLETAIGVTSLVASLLWLSWRSSDERRGALRRAAESSGVRPGEADGVVARRPALGIAMVALAAIVVAAIVPAAAAGAQRDVLRSAAGPEVDISRAVGPLAAYRAAFADERVDEVVFTVTGDLPDRIRLATLDSYDGEVFRTSADPEARFERVPAARSTAPGEPFRMTVEVAALDGLWMPTAGEVSSVEFGGARARTLDDGFYYSDPLAAAVETTPWRVGDSYTLAGVVPDVPDLAGIAAPGGVVSTIELPASMRTWIDEHVSGSGGAALAELVRLLRERGYLSHALDETDALWQQKLPGYAFVPSAAGHSLGRVADMFDALLDAEGEPAGADAADPASGSLVAAVGDDEQFAVAVALIAQDLGFPSRVVVGARLAADPTLTACAAGACTAGDLAAWVEVRAASGEWVPVDVTPQHAVAPNREVVDQPDPRVPTEVRPDDVEEVVPPRPAQQDATRGEAAPEAVDLDWLWTSLRVTALVAAAVAIPLTPLLLIVGAKAMRRRGRRRGDPVHRISGGWDEYVDGALDAGREPGRSLTRTEAAAAYGSPQGRVLAAEADRAVFSAGGVTTADADDFWRIVDAERRSWSAGFWSRVRAAVSLRSFVRSSEISGGAGQAKKPTTERGSRPAGRTP